MPIVAESILNIFLVSILMHENPHFLIEIIFNIKIKGEEENKEEGHWEIR